jgi:hypothetical protein
MTVSNQTLLKEVVDMVEDANVFNAVVNSNISVSVRASEPVRKAKLGSLLGTELFSESQCNFRNLTALPTKSIFSAMFGETKDGSKLLTIWYSFHPKLTAEPLSYIWLCLVNSEKYLLRFDLLDKEFIVSVNKNPIHHPTKQLIKQHRIAATKQTIWKLGKNENNANQSSDSLMIGAAQAILALYSNSTNATPWTLDFSIDRTKLSKNGNPTKYYWSSACTCISQITC